MDDQKPQTSNNSLWRCPQCSYDNIPDFQLCEMCFFQKLSGITISSQSTPSINYLKAPSKIQQKRQKLVCLDSNCKTQNNIHEIQCIKCGQFLIQGLDDDSENIPPANMALPKVKKIEKKEQKKTKAIICRWCNSENKPTVTACWHCTSVLTQNPAPQSTQPYIPKSKKLLGPSFCEECRSYEKEIRKGKGYLYECKCLNLEAISYAQKNFCNFCFEALKSGQHDEHALYCKQRTQFYDRNSQSYERCTPLQVHTIMYMNDKSEKLHYALQEKLFLRIQELGYTLKDLENLYFYIVNLAPIIIHMHADKHFGFYLNDTHYRNQFETSQTSGCKDLKVRGGWEDSMFDNLYKKAEPHERVKYGTMNFTNDPHGVSVCTGYGKSYFLLKEHVRNRCTMADEDQTIICTFRFCYQLLFNFTDDEICAGIEAAKAQEVKSEGVIAAYKEIQIHGPVEFTKDIERVYIHRGDIKRNPKCLDQVKEFCKKNNLQYEEFGHK